MNYRDVSRDHLKAATEQVEIVSDSSTKYAVLELRMAKEAFTCDRAVAFKEEFPIEEWNAPSIIGSLTPQNEACSNSSGLRPVANLINQKVVYSRCNYR